MRIFLLLIILANLGYLAWRQGWIADFLPPPVSVTQAPRMPAFVPAERQLQLLSETQNSTADRNPDQPQEQPLEQQSNALLEEQVVEAPSLQADSVLPEPRLVLPWCGQISGFADEAAANALLAQLPQEQLTVTLESAEVPVSSTWWVHMPAFESEAVALRMLEELQDNNIDSYYMRSGDLQGGISLGVFSRQESALTAQAQLARRGYATSIAEVFRMEDSYSLRLQLEDAALLQSEQWQQLLAGHDGLVLAENACEIIAPTNQFP